MVACAPIMNRTFGRAYGSSPRIAGFGGGMGALDGADVVAVVGSGTMGGGIAEVAALAGRALHD